MSIKFKLLNGAFLLLATGLTTESYAVCTQTNFTPQDVIMRVGRVVVRPSDEVGKILARGSFPMRVVENAITCDYTGAVDTVTNALTQNYPISPQGNSIYSTNIPGIGLRLYREVTNSSSFSGYYPFVRSLTPGTRYRVGDGFFIVEVVKTAPETGSGQIAPGRYSSYYMTRTPNRPLLTSSVVANAITIASSSCEIQGQINQFVQLKTVNKSDFKGVGSTAAEQPFNIRLLCSGGVNETGQPTTNDISVSFTYDTVANTNNVIANTNGSSQGRASGVGVQLVWNYKNQNSVVVNNEKKIVETINSNNTKQYDIPMKARYYQTDTNIRPGRVSGLAQVIINYD